MTLEQTIAMCKFKSNEYYDLARSYHTDENIYMKEEDTYRSLALRYENIAEFLEGYKTLSEKQHNISDEKLSQLETSIVNHIRESGVLTKEEIINIIKFEIERVRYE